MFFLNKNTTIYALEQTNPIKKAIQIFQRDQKKVFQKSKYEKTNKINLIRESSLLDEAYQIIIEEATINIYASSELGFMYSLLYLSKIYLNIHPFWFWMDQDIKSQEKIGVKEEVITSAKARVRYRGWFFNDEVLMMKWKYNQTEDAGWEMALEALLRCGGNMAIPGTDQMARKNRRLATNMGLITTHHHAEPLGAEMFARAYPDRQPNYLEQKELFIQLWEDAVDQQLGDKVIWNLCFRGQGDVPFWLTDSSNQYDTPKKRGKLISEIIQLQREIVERKVKNPVFCTNLYGEVMELYDQGYISIADDIIKVRADNGYGKMVTRRRDNHSIRINAMPNREDNGPQGIYYHVSFYDLQAANHLTMFPNASSFLQEELQQVLQNKGDEFWLINCSNVRPHVYFLDQISALWLGNIESDFSMNFVNRYFTTDLYLANQIKSLYEDYANAMILFQTQEDEHAGEQFYTQNIRLLIHQFFLNQKKGANELFWLTGDVTLHQQIHQLSHLSQTKDKELNVLLESIRKLKSQLPQTIINRLQATIGLSCDLHFYGREGVKYFAKGYFAWEEKDVKRAFFLFGQAREAFLLGVEKLKEAEYGHWEDFYVNDCFADYRHTAYMLEKMMGIMRELGDNSRHDLWYREFCYPKEDQKVFLLLVVDQHLTEVQLYEKMKEMNFC